MPQAVEGQDRHQPAFQGSQPGLFQLFCALCAHRRSDGTAAHTTARGFCGGMGTTAKLEMRDAFCCAAMVWWLGGSEPRGVAAVPVKLAHTSGERWIMAKKPARENIERGVSRDIEKDAIDIFKAQLPRHWEPQELKPDYNLDYHVVITEKESRTVTGRMFYVQLKGTANPQYITKKEVIAYPLELRRLTHFCDEVIAMPALLVVVDVKAKKAYWLYTQEFLRSNRDWRRRTKYALHIPIANDLADFQRLESEVERAIKEMRILSATALDRVRHEAARLEAIDPRFRVLPTITKDSEQYLIVPALTDVPIRFQCKSLEKGQALFGRGEQVSFEAGEYAFKDSPLFELLNDKNIVLQMQRRVETTIVIICLDAEGKEIGRSQEIPGVIEGGFEQWRFTSKKEGLPFTVELNPIAIDKPTGLRINITPAVWLGQQLLLASYFDTSLAFFNTFLKSFRFAVEMYYQDNWCFRFEAGTEGLEKLKPIVEMIGILDKARKIAKHFGLNPLCEDKTLDGAQRIGEISQLYELVFNKQYAYSKKESPWIITLHKDGIEKIYGKPIGLRLFLGISMPFLGEFINMGRLTLIGENVRVDIPENEFKSMSGIVDAPIVPTEEGRIVLRQMTDEEKAEDTAATVAAELNPTV
jgi:hypothetical protein